MSFIFRSQCFISHSRRHRSREPEFREQAVAHYKAEMISENCVARWWFQFHGLHSQVWKVARKDSYFLTVSLLCVGEVLEKRGGKIQRWNNACACDPLTYGDPMRGSGWNQLPNAAVCLQCKQGTGHVTSGSHTLTVLHAEIYSSFSSNYNCNYWLTAVSVAPSMWVVHGGLWTFLSFRPTSCRSGASQMSVTDLKRYSNRTLIVMMMTHMT